MLVADGDASPLSAPVQHRALALARPRAAVFPLWLIPLVIAAVLLRLAVASRFPPHVDEGNMLLGIQTVASRGWPLLPSGVLYIHGATISYLLAPLAWLGLLDYTNLFPLRAANALFGGVAVWLTWRLARDTIGPGWAPLAAAALVAVDPFNALWGGFIRMYALLQVLTLIVVWAFVRVIADEDLRTGDVAAIGERRRWLIVLTAGLWLAVFTQAVGALLWPPLALVALILYGRRLFGDRRDLTVALAISALAPVAFIGLSTFVGYGSTTTRSQQTDALPGASFLGDDALDLNRLVNPQLSGLQQVFAGGPVSNLVPLLVVLASGIVLGRFLLTARRRPGSAVEVGPADRVNPRALGTLLAVFWTPMLLFAFFVVEQKPRYLLNVQPLAWILAAAASIALRTAGAARPRWPFAVGVAIITLVLALHVAGGLWTMGEWGLSQTQSGVAPALAYVRDNRGPEDVTIVGSTPEAYLMLGDAQPMYAFGGVLERPGSVASGTKIDDWVGWEVLDSVDDLCSVLTDHPNTWFVLGENRLVPGRSASDITLGATDRLFSTPDGYQVLRSRPADTWNQDAVERCQPKARSA